MDVCQLSRKKIFDSPKERHDALLHMASPSGELSPTFINTHHHVSKTPMDLDDPQKNASQNAVQAPRPIGVSTAAAAPQQAARILASGIKRQNLSTASAPLSHAALHCAASRSRASIGAATGAASPSTSASTLGAGAAVTAMAETKIVRALMIFILAGNHAMSAKEALGGWLDC
ncbi:MAG: hypothetical protein LQ337_000954 [Flavoplaca oasis]|nr:MAG: hypothetical protein LQ337_000954 [Flavoplaca oasis]